MAELADAADSKSAEEIHEGSSPSSGTISPFSGVFLIYGIIITMENKKKKSLIEYLDNRDAIIIGLSFILVSFFILITFYSLQNHQEVFNPKNGKNGYPAYPSSQSHKWLFTLSVIFALIGFILCETYLIRIVTSLRNANNWKWQNKNKLQTIFITIPSIAFGVLAVLFFGSIFVTGTTMSTYGYNSNQRAYIIALYTLTPISFAISALTFSPWIITPLFNKITSKFGQK